MAAVRGHGLVHLTSIVFTYEGAEEVLDVTYPMQWGTHTDVDRDIVHLRFDEAEARGYLTVINEDPARCMAAAFMDALLEPEEPSTLTRTDQGRSYHHR